MNQPTTPEAILSTLVSDILDRKRSGHMPSWSDVNREVEQTIKEVALPGLEQNVRKWVGDVIDSAALLGVDDIDVVVHALLAACPVWTEAAIIDTTLLESGHEVALLSADTNAITSAIIEHEVVKVVTGETSIGAPIIEEVESVVADGYRLDPWGRSINETVWRVNWDQRPYVRVVEMTDQIKELMEVVPALRECRNRVKTITPQVPADMHELRQEVDRLEMLIMRLEKIGMSQVVTWI